MGGDAVRAILPRPEETGLVAHSGQAPNIRRNTQRYYLRGLLSFPEALYLLF